MLDENLLNQIKSEVKKYINLENEEQQALIEKVTERVKEWESDGLDPNITAIVYELATDFDEWYQV